jgi:hypothetical protein
MDGGSTNVPIIPSGIQVTRLSYVDMGIPAEIKTTRVVVFL